MASGNTNTSVHIRNPDLSFFSKFLSIVDTAYNSIVDSDGNYIYLAKTTSGSVRRISLDFSASTPYAGLVPSPRMIDASGDPLYGYVTSNNATDGHGVRMVKKSTMGVVASMLATGTGDNQFTNPLGVFFVSATSKLYICEATRIVELNVTRTDGAEALTWSTSYPIAANDLYWNGKNWFVQSSTQTIKYDSSFTDATKTTTACVGYSITGIPDQGDGHGATLCIVNNSGSCLYRRKQSDLSLTTTVGSAGDGSASLFDPTFTTSSNTRITYTFDDGFSYTTPSGTSHALSWNGFAGYSFRSAGPHRCVVRVECGLGLVTAIDCSTDFITSLKGLRKLISCTSFILSVNETWPLDIKEISPNATTFQINSNLLAYGGVSSISRLATAIRLQYTSISGTLADLPATSQTVYAYNNTSITSASIAHLVNIRDLRIYSMGWSQANVDLIIDSMWQARASYTYAAGPSLQIGGTNAAPTGNLIAPVEGSDWHNDGLKWIPLTGKAKVWDMLNDVNSEGFHKWFSIATS